jgi:hypothetical protein
MTKPITPPPELVQQWLTGPEYVSSWNGKCTLISVTNHRLGNVCAKAAQWGADQELEACLVEASFLASRSLADRIRATRRPKPPSLKEQALAIMSTDSWSIEDEEIIRAALEALPND